MAVLGVSNQKLYNVLNGKSGITLEMAFGGSAELWLRMQAAYDLALVCGREIEVARFSPLSAYPSGL